MLCKVSYGSVVVEYYLSKGTNRQYLGNIVYWIWKTVATAHLSQIKFTCLEHRNMYFRQYYGDLKWLMFVYYFSNSIFASADAAYVLAYSVIMLTTDLHSTQVYYCIWFVPMDMFWVKLRVVRIYKFKVLKELFVHGLTLDKQSHIVELMTIESYMYFSD